MAKLAYINTEVDGLKALKKGIELNVAAWIGQPDTAATVQADIDELELADSDIAGLEAQISQKRAAARQLATAKAAKISIISQRAQGIHAANPEKWVEYGIVAGPTPATTRPAPAKGVIISVADDSDGIGFVVNVQTLDYADTYEYERGMGKAEDANTIPAFTHFLSTKKSKIVDDDVIKGTPYFYRYRGINSNGNGECSEPVSRVQ